MSFLKPKYISNCRDLLTVPNVPKRSTSSGSQALYIKTVLNHYVCVLTRYGCRGIKFTKAIPAVLCLGHGSLMKPKSFLAVFEFNVFLLLEWLLH